MRFRIGMSLIEVIIAVAIFATLMAMVTEASMGVTHVANEDEARDDLSAAGRRALEVIAKDLQATAWFYDWTDTNGDGEPSPGEAVNYRMPWVNPPWYATTGAAGDGVANYSDGSGAAAPSDDVPHADRLLFPRLQSSFAVTGQPNRFMDVFPFDDPDYAPVRMSSYMYGSPVPELVLNAGAPAGSDTNFLTQRWDSDVSNNWTQNRDKSRLRLFAYVMRASTRTSMGCLVRMYRNSSAWSLPLQASTFVEDSEMCDWVESVHFDTWRSLSSLNPNQIRVILILRKDASNSSGTSVRRRFEATFAMRSITYED